MIAVEEQMSLGAAFASFLTLEMLYVVVFNPLASVLQSPS